jgi:drug/metabolite transporter (DMT)-like permease
MGGAGFHGAGLWYFVIGGLIGMGLGDLAVFAGLPMLGARLMVVMTQCLAAPIAAMAEWGWLGTRLSPTEIVASSVILAGVALAVSPSKKNPPRVRVRTAGVVLGILAAAGQGFGAVFSRKAYNLSFAAGEQIDGGTATFQRLVGGFAITLVFLATQRVLRSKTPQENASDGEPPRVEHGVRRWRWTLANGLCGPVLGVSCYQWALATTPSGIILPIVATTPLVAIPLAYWIDGEKATRRSLIGTFIAVAGAAALARMG